MFGRKGTPTLKTLETLESSYMESNLSWIWLQNIAKYIYHRDFLKSGLTYRNWRAAVNMMILRFFKAPNRWKTCRPSTQRDTFFLTVSQLKCVVSTGVDLTSDSTYSDFNSWNIFKDLKPDNDRIPEQQLYSLLFAAFLYHLQSSKQQMLRKFARNLLQETCFICFPAIPTCQNRKQHCATKNSRTVLPVSKT